MRLFGPGICTYLLQVFSFGAHMRTRLHIGGNASVPPLASAFARMSGCISYATVLGARRHPVSRILPNLPRKLITSLRSSSYSRMSVSIERFRDMAASERHNSRRLGLRRRVLLGGIVSFGQGAHWFDCTIRDMTKDGARLGISEIRQIPTNFYLIVVRDQIARGATVVWHKGVVLGVALAHSIDLSQGLDPALGFLRKQWLERAGRYSSLM